MSESDSDSRHDLREAPFDDFVRFLFDHEVVPFPRDKNIGPFPWYWHLTVDCDPDSVIAYYTRLFTAPRFLLRDSPSISWSKGSGRCRVRSLTARSRMSSGSAPSPSRTASAA